MIEKEEFRDRWIPHRMQAVATCHLALNYVLHSDDPRQMEIRFDGVPVIEGLSTGFTNPAIEAGIMHGRALLEFVGLKVRGNGVELVERSDKRTDDYGVEDFEGPNGPLPKVTIQDALSYYNGDAGEAERAFARIIFLANKGLAHCTSRLAGDHDDLHLLEIATRGIPALIVSRFYTPMGLHPPEYELKTRARTEDAQQDAGGKGG